MATDGPEIAGPWIDVAGRVYGPQQFSLELS